MNTTTPDERREKEGLAREPRELSSEELESIIGGVGIELRGDERDLYGYYFDEEGNWTGILIVHKILYDERGIGPGGGWLRR
jgi:hypothetical protein